ncbi:MAG TPA: DUF3592 domain-containing protein [Ktedonobacterales bacterium]|nr:DUF3592 domain-containing protein [Ktedonobacterales bacterium]
MTAILLIPLGFLIVGIGCGIWALNEWRIQKKLHEQGIATKAKVIDRGYASPGSHGSKMYFVAYRYQHEAQPYERRQGVSKATYDASAIGKRIAIRFLPDHPSTARIEGEHTTLFAPVVISIVFVVLALVFIIVGLTAS